MDAAGVRPLHEDDLASIAALRFRCFQRSRYEEPKAVERMLHAAFVAHPWSELGIRSLVYADEHGRIVGFRGLVGRPMRYRGEPIVAAVSSQFMVEPGARGQGVAVALMRATLTGPQDLLFADRVNPTARQLWRLLRGTEIVELSLQWTRPLQPMQWLAGRLGSARTTTWLRRLAFPVLRGLDVAARGDRGGPFGFANGATSPSLSDLSSAEHHELMTALGNSYELVPVYDERSLDWTVSMLNAGLHGGERLVRKRVHDAGGSPCGFFVAILGGGIATVVQIGATRAGLASTLDGLARFASDARCIEIRGRVQPEQWAGIARSPAHILIGEPRFMVVARRPELIEAIRSGRAWLSRLDGEWGLGF